ncbi:MAG: hypothetical protein J7619_23470 [Dyadobacter sp.]|uniref:sensor histidine kinase n=1 Tax=Dyadobacter sp. TaxID=1914288 RepID=UPI001B062AF7|nr:sensor histidine kinase [Dyadobacter sp.]MBO9615676.1 hypothetical protein [Dyadobacter sp.]
MILPIRLRPIGSALAACPLLCIALYFSCLHFPAKAQQSGLSYDKYALTQYTAETGLPQNSIKAIVKDDAGFYWLATEDGLARFDGRHFHIFNSSNARFDSNRMIQSFRGISDSEPYFVGETHEIFKISAGTVTKTAMHDKEFKRLNINNFPLQSHFLNFELTNRHIYNYGWKYSVVPVSPGSYFICDTANVTFFKHNKPIYHQRNHADRTLDYFNHGQELYHYDRPNATITRIDRNGLHNVAITGDVVRDYGAPAGQKDLEVLWNTFSENLLMASGGKIYSVDFVGRDTLDTKLILEGFDTEKNKIISSFYDKTSGTLLLGSHTNGLFVFTKKHFYAFKGSEGFSFHEQILFKNRYIITHFGAYDIYSKGGAPASISDKFKGRNPFRAKTGYTWATKAGILSLFEEESAHLVKSWPIGADVSITYTDPDGHLWLGHRHGLLRRLDTNTFKWTDIRIAGLKNIQINFILRDNSPDPAKQTFWMGTTEGLYRFTFPGCRFEKIKNLGNSAVHSLLLRCTRDGTEVWGTIYGQGLFLIKDNHTTLFPLDRKKHLGSAHCITEDKNGFFWVPTNKGLFQIGLNDLLAFARKQIRSPYYFFYDYQSGFPTNEFNGGCIPCSLTLPNGLLSLPSISGLVYFYPSLILPQLPDKPLLIDRIEYNGKRIGYSDSLTLDSDFESIKFSVSTPYFGNPDNVQIDYSLSGNHQRGLWHPVRDGGEIVFNGLGSGEYVLSIRKRNGFGKENYMARRMTFTIAPEWYATWWFRTSLLLCMILSVYAFFKWRTGAIKRKNEDLERAVTERTAALKESQNELSRQLNIQAHLIASITHDVRAPLKYVTQASGQIARLNELGQREMLSQVGNALEQSLVQMTNFLDNLLSYVRTTLYHTKVEMTPIDLSGLVGEKLVLFEKVFLLYKNEVVNEVPPGLTITSNPELLSVVIHNLIDNASKYARNGQIRIFSSVTGHTVHLIIADSGKGIDAEIREWFNNPNATHSESYGNTSPKGFGLVIVKEVARLINLSVFVDNHNGCEFHLVFDTPDYAGRLH